MAAPVKRDDMVDAIDQLRATLGLEARASYNGVSNKDLEAELESLRKQAAEKAKTEAVDTALNSQELEAPEPPKKDDSMSAEKKSEAPASKVEVKPCFVVAEGKALTTKRGVVSGGQGIEPRDLHGGDADFKVHCDKGRIVPATKA
jgi:hypothetical protein